MSREGKDVFKDEHSEGGEDVNGNSVIPDPEQSSHSKDENIDEPKVEETAKNVLENTGEQQNSDLDKKTSGPEELASASRISLDDFRAMAKSELKLELKDIKEKDDTKEHRWSKRRDHSGHKDAQEDEQDNPFKRINRTDVSFAGIYIFLFFYFYAKYYFLLSPWK